MKQYQPMPDTGYFCPVLMMMFDEQDPESWLVDPRAFVKFEEEITLEEANQILQLKAESKNSQGEVVVNKEKESEKESEVFEQ